MAHVTVFSGAQRRRRWSIDQKRAAVAAAFAPGAVVSAIARRAEVAPGQIYRWRRELGEGAVGFARVEVNADPPSVTTCDPALVVEFGNAVVRIAASAPAALAAAVLGALVR